MSEVDVAGHVVALAERGFTTVPGQLGPDQLEDLRAESDSALAAVRTARESGRTVPFAPGSRYYEAANALYCWGPAALSLLLHPAAVAIAGEMLSDYCLNDLTVFSALPATAAGADAGATGWHRDCNDFTAQPTSGHLWFLFYLDTFTGENGATWVAPGSHRRRSPSEPALGGPWTAPDLDAFPARVQLVGEAGDLSVIDARVLHTSDLNRTSRPRRLVNLGLVARQFAGRVKTDHWATAGPRIQATADERLRRLLQARSDDFSPHGPRSVLPQGWEGGP